MALFRRLTSFNKSKKPGEDGKANGISTGTSTSTPAQQTTTAQSNTTANGYAPAAVKHEEPHEDVHAANRADVTSTFEQYAQLIHASQRPLPNQSGDGAYLEKDEPSGFWSDMRSLGIKDLKTVRHIMEDKASGKPQDDRKMHMEEIMQVSNRWRPGLWDAGVFQHRI